MRILQVNNMGIQFGFDHSAVNQYRGIVDSMPGVEIVLLRDRPIAEEPGVEVLTLPRSISRLPWLLRSLYRVGQAVGAIHKHRIDFVHGVHLWPAGMIAWLAARLTGRRCGVTIVAGSREIHYLGGAMRRAALFVLKRCDAVVVTGEKTREHLAGWGLDREKVTVIPNATDIDAFRPMPEAEKSYHLVSTNRLFPVKNIEAMLRAIALARREIPGLKAALGGTGPEEEKLKALARELDLEKTVDFLGWMDDVAETLNRGRVYMLTSRSEGFPISVLEAMACGLPSVVSDVGDMTDVARDGWNGFVIDDCDDAEGFARAFVKILTDRALETRLAGNALSVRETHSYEAAAAAWRKILERTGR